MLSSPLKTQYFPQFGSIGALRTWTDNPQHMIQTCGISRGIV